MSSRTIKELRSMGVSDEDIQLARVTQEAQRRTGSPVLSIGAIVGASQPRSPAPTINITDRALRTRGTYDQAALLLDQQALRESSPERAEKARQAAKSAKELSSARQLEFDFFGGGNVSVAHEYLDVISDRLMKSPVTLAKRNEALAVLWTMTRHMAWQSYEVTKTASELSDLTGIGAANLSRTLNLLENIGAIRRVKRGRRNIITITPEGVYRGNVQHHGQAVERYRLDVIDGGKNEIHRES